MIVYHVDIIYISNCCSLCRLAISYDNLRRLYLFATNLAFAIFLSSGTDGFQESTEAGVTFGVIFEKPYLVAIIPRVEMSK
jgi:hypothetical protein